MLTVGVVSLDTKNSAALLAMLQQTGLVQPIAQWDLMAGEGPTSRTAVPDVVLVEIGRDAKSPLEFAARMNRLNPACLYHCLFGIPGAQPRSADAGDAQRRAGIPIPAD